MVSLKQQQTLRELLDGLGPRSGGYKYPADVKRQVGDYVRRARRSGRRFGELSRALGPAESTLARWARSSSGGLKPVRVVCAPVELPVEQPEDPAEAPVAARAEPSANAGVVAPVAPAVNIVSPAGWRIEGLTLREAVTVFQEVGQ